MTIDPSSLLRRHPTSPLCASLWGPVVFWAVLTLVACSDDSPTTAAIGQHRAGDAGDTTYDGDGQPVDYDDERGAWVVGYSVEGRPIIAEQFGTGGPVLFLFAAIHGDERSAVTCGEQIRAPLVGGLAERAGVRIVFIGAANPDGIAIGKRRNVRGIDINRNFPSANFEDGDGSGGTEPLSEPETGAILATLNATAPDAVLTIHCCVPTLDYDGPAEEIALAMRRSMHSDAQFPVVRLGSMPGSAGSLIGVDRNIPIVTVEFAVDEEIDTRTQLESVELAVEAATDWVARYGSSSGAIDLASLQPAGANVESFVLAVSAGGLAIRADTILGGDEPPVLVLAGLTDTDRQSLNVAEHVRRVLLSSVRGLPVVILTVANPDGIAQGGARNADGRNVATDLFDETFETAEADGLDALLESLQPRMAVVIETDDSSSSVARSESAADWAVGSVPEGLEDRGVETGSIYTFFDERNIPVVRVGVHAWYGRGDDRVGDRSPATDPSLFSTFTRRIIKPGVLCAEDLFCDPYCLSDPDCDCGCDYNPVCEAMSRDSTEPCDCDPDCRGGGEACSLDDHCDTWCPADVDPDCSCGCDYNPVCEVEARGSTVACGCDPDCAGGEVPCGDDGHCDTWCPSGTDPDC